MDGRTIYHPKDIMDEKMKHYKKLWAPTTVSLSDTRELFRQIRAEATDAPLEPIGPTSIVKACRRMKANAGTGVDGFTP
eukprot:2363993-Pyramimonas_sp.AAC.1